MNLYWTTDDGRLMRARVDDDVVAPFAVNAPCFACQNGIIRMIDLQGGRFLCSRDPLAKLDRTEHAVPARWAEVDGDRLRIRTRHHDLEYVTGEVRP